MSQSIKTSSFPKKYFRMGNPIKAKNVEQFEEIPQEERSSFAFLLKHYWKLTGSLAK